MEGEIRESLILTQEQLDELASVFKSVKRSVLSCRSVVLLAKNIASGIIKALDKLIAIQVSLAEWAKMRKCESHNG